MHKGFLAKSIKGAAVGSVLLLASAVAPAADETDARAIMSSMTGYLTSLKAFSFGFDEYHEVVTTDGEKIGLSSSGTITLERPDRIRATRNFGYTQVEFAHDGQALSIYDAASALFARQSLPGDLEQLIDSLRDDYGLPLPAADLLTGAGYNSLVTGATEVKDLGVGVVSGAECDHFAFRGEEVDWQVWIARSETPYPCMLIITSRNVPQAPQYRFEISDFRPESAGTAYSLEKPDAATEVGIAEFVAGAGALPGNFMLETKQ